MRRSASRALVIALALVSAALWPAAATAGGGGCYGATQGTGDEVEMAKACFTPSVLRVDPGTAVTFLNTDPYAHNVSATGWGSEGDLKKGDTFSAMFDEEGTFPYACMYHYGMTGAIVVGDGVGPASGTPVEIGLASETAPVSEENANSLQAAPARSGIVGWAVTGGIGLVIGAALGGMLLRRRREG